MTRHCAGLDSQGAREHEKGNRASGVYDVCIKTQQDPRACYRCNQDNQIVKDCRMKNMGRVKTKHVKGETGKYSKRENLMQEDGEDSNKEEVFTVYHMKDSDITIQHAGRNSNSEGRTNMKGVKSK